MPQQYAADLPEMANPESSGVHVEKPAGPGHTGEWSQITAAQPSTTKPESSIRIDLGQLSRILEVGSFLVSKLGPTAALILASAYLLPPAFDRIHRGYAEIADKHEKAVQAITTQMDKQNSQTERAIDKLATSLDKLSERMIRNPKGP